MKNELIQNHPYSIKQGSDGRYRTRVKDETKPDGRRMIAKSTLEELHKAIIADSKKREEKQKSIKSNLYLENISNEFFLWRRDIGTDPNTIKENVSDWNLYLKDSELSKYKIQDIHATNIEDFFYKITKNHAITFKKLTNIRSVISGIFKYAIRNQMVNRSVVFDVDYGQYRTRCKPSGSNKETYSDNDRKAITRYLEDKTDVFSLAILFAFKLCLRISEIQTIKKSDIKDDFLSVERSIKRCRIMKDDFTFEKTQYIVEPRIKGNSTEGIRKVALSPKAQEIAKKTIELYPNGVYLFEYNGKPITYKSFNRHLKKTCEAVGVKYLPSHQIRFTSATNLIAKIPINLLANELGHSQVRTTFLYTRKRVADEHSKNLIAQVQDI